MRSSAPSQAEEVVFSMVQAHNPGGAEDRAVLAQRAQALSRAVLDEVGRSFVGHAEIPELILTALLARGHCLLEGVPGVAKTTLIKAVAGAICGSFKRIQFTPDLLPSDITGTYVLSQRDGAFTLRHGPIFSHVVLGDEINRAPAKTQSALLEAMQEHQVTIDGETHRLAAPFFVLATQNPIEQEGTYPLPEAQVDRFLMRIVVPYPSAEDEIRTPFQGFNHYTAKPKAFADQLSRHICDGPRTLFSPLHQRVLPIARVLQHQSSYCARRPRSLPLTHETPLAQQIRGNHERHSRRTTSVCPTPRHTPAPD